MGGKFSYIKVFIIKRVFKFFKALYFKDKLKRIIKKIKINKRVVRKRKHKKIVPIRREQEQTKIVPKAKQKQHNKGALLKESTSPCTHSNSKNQTHRMPIPTHSLLGRQMQA